MELPSIVEEVFSVKQWRSVHHHDAHALLGFHASPFRSALVISYDGGGNDGWFNVYIRVGLELHRGSEGSSGCSLAYVKGGMWCGADPWGNP